MTNIEIVREIYANFATRNVPAILERLADDVDWEYGATSDEIPWLTRRRGREAVLGFFQAVGAGLEFTRFEVAAVLGEGDVVVALCNVDAVVRATGKRFSESPEVHLFYFDGRGRVARFRHAADTLAHYRALQP